ncbi:MAG: hypothetical protein ACRECN_08150 [Methylocella sp.]
MGIIDAGFLSPGDRAGLIAVARDGLPAHRLARRANALVLLGDGLSFEEIARVLFVNVDTIRSRFCLDEDDGIADATLSFLREKVPKKWAKLRDSVSGNFRVISPEDFRVVT